jgi:hypothetical protein
MVLIILYPLFRKKMSKVNYIIISKFVKPSLPYSYTNKGCYIELIILGLFLLIVLYLKFLFFSDDNLNVVSNYINILNIKTLLLCLIISVDNYYLFYVLILKILFVIKIKLIEIYINIKSDPWNYITKKITLFFCIKYVLLIIYVSGIDQCIFCYLTYDSLLKFILSLRKKTITPLYIYSQSEELKNFIVNKLSENTKLTKDFIVNTIKFTPNEYEFLSILMGIDRFNKGCVALEIYTPDNNPQINSGVKFIHTHKLLHTTQPGSGSLTGILEDVGIRKDLDTILEKHPKGVFIYYADDH